MIQIENRGAAIFTFLAGHLQSGYSSTVEQVCRCYD